MRKVVLQKIAKFASHACNAALVAAIFIGVPAMQQVPNVAASTGEPVELTVGYAPDANPHQFPDPTTLSFIDAVEETTVDEAPQADKELYWLAKGIYFEARGESLEGQMLVAQSILNRAEDPRWPNTVEGVIRQGEEKRNRCQFSFMCDGQKEVIHNETAWATALKIARQARELVQSGFRLGCAHSYHAVRVTNEAALRWFGTLERDTQVGEHIFYCG